MTSCLYGLHMCVPSIVCVFSCVVVCRTCHVHVPLIALLPFLPHSFFVPSSLFLPPIPPSLPAERKTSLGKDWHPTCLRCDNCDRLLTPGKHSEVQYTCTCVHVHVYMYMYTCTGSSPVQSILVLLFRVVCLRVY